MLVTSDIISAYHDIPQEDRSEYMREALEEREVKIIATDFLVKLMELTQKCNLFSIT